MKNEQSKWAKVLLSSYRYLGALSEAIDKLVETTAKNSYYFNSVWSDDTSIMNVSNKIIKLSQRKIDYINIKVVVEKILRSMPTKMAKLLILKYIQNVSTEDASKVLNISLRTCYRKSDLAIQKFADSMIMMGLTPEKLELNYMGDSFINSLYKLVDNYNYVIKERAFAPNTEGAFNSYINEIVAKFA